MRMHPNQNDPLQRYVMDPYSQESEDTTALEVEGMLAARHTEIQTWKDMTTQRGTPIPALYQTFYKFIQNPSAISVETFKRMVDTDDTIGSGLDFLATCLSARMGRYQHKSPEITEWVNKHLEEIEGGWVNKIKEMLSAAWAGFFVGEKVWANKPDGFVIESIPALPPTTILFEVDRMGRLTPDGILQYQRNWNPVAMSLGIGFYGSSMSNSGWFPAAGTPDPFAKLGDLPFPLRTANSYNYLSIRIPTQKCVHYAFDAQGKFGNPYGRSLLRRAYKYYVMKDAFLKMLATALDRKGTPLTVVFADPNMTVIDRDKFAAAGGVTARGQNIGKRADEAAKDVFKNIHNDSVIILPGKKGQYYDVEAISQECNAEVFISSINLCDKGMLRSLLVPGLIFGTGDGSGSFSLGQEHARTFDKILDGMNAGLVQTIKEQVIRDMLMYNFPRSAWEKDGLGDFSQRELTTEERQKEMEVMESAINCGLADPATDLDELNDMRERIGMGKKESLIVQVQFGGEDGFGSEGEEGSGDPGSDEGKPASDGTKKGQSSVDDPRGAHKPGGGSKPGSNKGAGGGDGDKGGGK